MTIVLSQGSGSCTSSAKEGGDGARKGGMSGVVGGSWSTGRKKELDWSKGRFAVFAMAPSNPYPLVVGRINDIIRGEYGDEAVLHWYSPKKVPKRCPRSQYGKAGWSEDYVINEKGRRVPDVSNESTKAACYTFANVVSGDKLPLKAWTAVLHKQVTPPAVDPIGDDED